MWGFEPECAVMCRAALQTALLQRLEGLYDSDSKEPSLDELLRIAGEKAILGGFERTRSTKGWRARTETALWRARQIKLLGDYAVHDRPALHPELKLRDSYEAIRELSLVLDELFPPPG